ncbi:MAG: GNAT family N-acetyltransferase [Betaproteobacteria bacterium]|nr:MAG: GNAT family N-acetyltransferase [Betaproteobacteria bacterium]
MPDFTIRTADWSRDEGRLKSVRYDVFCVEQGVPEDLEWDGLDSGCVHAIAEDVARRAIGCGRLLPDGHVGRMAVRADWRGRGVGGALLAHLVGLARARGDAKAMLNAQAQAIPFYERFGFVAVGEPFEEAGIPHVAMERALR